MPGAECAISDAISNAELILRGIDERWPEQRAEPVPSFRILATVTIYSGYPPDCLSAASQQTEPLVAQ